MNAKLTKRGAEIAQNLMIYMASFDCLTLSQCVALTYAKIDAASVAGMQRKLKTMMQQKLIGRQKSDDGLYRYYLLEAGARTANEVLQFTATAGSDRHYLNSSRHDAVIDKLTADMHATAGGRALGRGALRRSLGGKYSDFDGLLVSETENAINPVRAYIGITTANLTGIQRFEKAARHARTLKIPLEVVGPEIVKKYFKTHRV